MTAHLTLQTFVDRKSRTANKWFALVGFPGFADTFVKDDSTVFRIKFSAKTTHQILPQNVSSNLK
jgi:hypothetical protein